jgi:hypothetical protein
MAYLTQWLHAYVTHFGAWMSFAFACYIHKKGIPKSDILFPLLKSAALISLILSLFSSHAHTHYMNYVGKNESINSKSSQKERTLEPAGL